MGLGHFWDLCSRRYLIFLRVYKVLEGVWYLVEIFSILVDIWLIHTGLLANFMVGMKIIKEQNINKFLLNIPFWLAATSVFGLGFHYKPVVLCCAFRGNSFCLGLISYPVLFEIAFLWWDGQTFCNHLIPNIFVVSYWYKSSPYPQSLKVVILKI